MRVHCASSLPYKLCSDDFQNYLTIIYAGISLSSPQDLSGDDGEVEESISSKMVELDEEEEEKRRQTAVMEDEALFLQGINGAEAHESYENQEIPGTGDEDNYEDDFEVKITYLFADNFCYSIFQ